MMRLETGIPDDLLALARSLGATAAAVIPAPSLVVDDRFADFCATPQRCPSYGLAPGCPPHAMSPAVFRDKLKHYRSILVFKIDAPAADLLSDKRLSVARSIHLIAAGVEQAARDRGFTMTRGLAAGSCKELFCGEEDGCPVLHGQQPCRHPDLARPSISAVGVDFAALAALVGWEFGALDPNKTASGEQAMGLMAGLVLLG